MTARIAATTRRLLSQQKPTASCITVRIHVSGSHAEKFVILVTRVGWGCALMFGLSQNYKNKPMVACDASAMDFDNLPFRPFKSLQI